jgi:predicted neuraminidase
VMLIKNPQQALVLMRFSGASPKRVIATTTDDAGQHWSLPGKTALTNPDAAITGAVLPDGRILAVLNNIEIGRDVLSLMVSSDDGNNWKKVYQLENQHDQPTETAHYMQTTAELAKATEPSITEAMSYAKSAQRNKCEGQNCGFEFSYPYLIQTHNGDFHLVYTWNRSFIKHVWFTRAWLAQRMEKYTDAKLH